MINFMGHSKNPLKATNSLQKKKMNKHTRNDICR